MKNYASIGTENYDSVAVFSLMSQVSSKYHTLILKTAQNAALI